MQKKAWCLAAILGVGGLGVVLSAQRSQDPPAEGLEVRIATDAQQREILQLVLEADKHWPMRPQARSSAPVTAHAPLVLLDSSFAFGKGITGNVYPDPSCRDDAIGKAIVGEGGLAGMVINGHEIEDYSKSLAQALVLKNQVPHGLTDPHLRELTEMSAREMADIFRAKPNDWNHFFQRIPDVAGYVQVSRAVLGNFGAKEEEALIYVYEGYQPGCGSGTLYTLNRSKFFPTWTISSMGEPSSKPRPPMPTTLKWQRAPEPIATGPDAGKISGLDVQIQLVKDQRTVDLIESGKVPEDFVPEQRQEQSSVRVKLADSHLRFAIVMRNTGKKLWPPGTEFDVVVKCNKEIAMAGGFTMTRTLKPGEFDVLGSSVACPVPSKQMSIHVKFATGRSSQGEADAAALDVQLIP
jgi:hypothetical protein